MDAVRTMKERTQTADTTSCTTQAAAEIVMTYKESALRRRCRQAVVLLQTQGQVALRL